MFDNKDYDSIMEEMLDDFGQDVNTDEGSLAYNACAKIAEQLEDTYGEMDAINNNMTPDTMDLEHLINFGKTQRGIDFKYATAPVVRGVFKQEIEVGQQFTCCDYTYTVTEQITGFEYKLSCDTEGIEANQTMGELEPVDFVDDYQGGQITEIIAKGTEDEDTEIFRSRVIETFQSTAFGGNKADYREKVNSLAGVGGCKPKRREAGSKWINVYIIGSDYDVPAQKVVTAVQTAIDPEQSHGEGDGLAPICHEVLIKPVEAVTVDVSLKITWDSGYSADTSKSAIDAAVQEYLLNLRQTWESTGLNTEYVRINQIEAKILSVEGVVDVADTTLNGTAGNIKLNYTQIPTFGGVVIV